MTKASSYRARQARLTTGIPSLDTVLGGGIPKGSAVFICGLPGVGKTVLCEQALFANAQYSESVLYVTTLSEPPVKMLQFTQAFEFFQPELIDRNVHYADLGDALRSGGAAESLAELERLLKLFRPDFLVLDSFKVFREHFDEVHKFRAFVADVTILLATWEATALLVGEYSFDDISTEPEFAIADGIIHLSGTEEELRQKRYMNIVKMRGADTFFGRHSYEISGAGMTVYPRMLPRTQGEYVLSDERYGSCIDGLSEMMDGGIIGSTVLLISGGTGSGKTLTALSFAVKAAQTGVRSLVVSFEESPNQLVRNCEDFGWETDRFVREGVLQFQHIAPSELDLDRNAIEIKDAADSLGAKLVVIDSITAFGDVGLGVESELSAYLWALSDYFKRSGISLIMVSEAYSFFESGASGMGRGASYLADAIILLRLQEEDGTVQRKINVLKMRGSAHAKDLRELRIEQGSISIA